PPTPPPPLFPYTTLFRSTRARARGGLARRKLRSIFFQQHRYQRAFSLLGEAELVVGPVDADEVTEFDLAGGNKVGEREDDVLLEDRKSTRLNSSHSQISY